MHTISPYLAEFLGTMIMVTIGCGVIATVELRRSKGHGDNFFTIAFGWGFAVAFGVYASHHYSGGHLNPAVSIGLAAYGEFPWSQVPGYIISQLLGAMVGAVFVYLNYLPHWKATEDRKIKLGVFATVPAIHNYFTNALSEMIGTFLLVFSALYVGVNFTPALTGSELTLNLNDVLKPLAFGFMVTVLVIGLGGQTGFALNPARDLGPRIMHAILPIFGKGSSRWYYSWVPIAAPIAGGFMGGSFFKLYYEGIFSPFLFISCLLALAVLAFGLWANKHMYRSQSAEIVPTEEDTQATAASAAATYVATGKIPQVKKKSFYE
ncbi:MIP/aquaporin family protein [Rothia aerolata]|uniref:Glycerol transporter n=1 Tax=Rothia aerolata TaxID=1812262 RepID=A0A917INI8_9MICC|nr:MIP/aquaporin family protein [Rothia aerolata]GGH58046.1 glycerol transporter [Rothia aerolata]